MNYIRSSSDSSVKAVRRKTLTAIIMAVMTSLSAFSFHGCSMDENKTAEESSVSTAVTETSAAQSLTVCSTSETRPDNTSALTTLVTSENTSAVTTSPVTSSVKVTTEFDNGYDGPDPFRYLYKNYDSYYSSFSSNYDPDTDISLRYDEHNEKHDISLMLDAQRKKILYRNFGIGYDSNKKCYNTRWQKCDIPDDKDELFTLTVYENGTEVQKIKVLEHDTGKEEYGKQEYVQYMVFTESDGSEMCVTKNISLSEDSIKGISEFYYYVDPSWDGNKLSDSYKDLFPAQSIKFSFMRSGYIVFRSGEYRLESSEKRGNIFQAEISEPQLLSDSETDILNNYFTSHDLVEVNTDIAKLFSQDMKFCIYVPDKEKLVISFYRNRKLVNFADENDEHVYMLADAEQLDALYDIASQYESVISD